MKTNTLSNLSGVNAETIRKYRDRSLLRPACNPENGYYEYSQADFLNLLYIRKLRGANLSIDSIVGTYVCEESESLRQNAGGPAEADPPAEAERDDAAPDLSPL